MRDYFEDERYCSKLKLILASASPRRKEILNQIGIKFTACPADIDESPAGFTDAREYAVEMARQKALYVAENLAGNNKDRVKEQVYVLGADTTVEIEGQILIKPEDYDDAFRMLSMIQGKWHQVTTGIALVDSSTLKPCIEKECSNVKIRDLTDDMIRAYLATGESFDKAGSYGVQGYGSLLVEKIDGCYFNVMGLPVFKLSQLLEKMGFGMLSWMKQKV